MQHFTTELLTLTEFIERRKIGRTTAIERCKSGVYVEGIDFECDGNERKFFWPPKEFYMRDRRLHELCSTGGIDGERPSQPIPGKVAPPVCTQNTRPAVEAGFKPARKKMPPSEIPGPVNRKIESPKTSRKKAAFVV